MDTVLILAGCFILGTGVGIGVAIGLEIAMRVSGDNRTVILTFARTTKGSETNAPP